MSDKSVSIDEQLAAIDALGTPEERKRIAVFDKLAEAIFYAINGVAEKEQVLVADVQLALTSMLAVVHVRREGVGEDGMAEIAHKEFAAIVGAFAGRSSLILQNRQ